MPKYLQIPNCLWAIIWVPAVHWITIGWYVLQESPHFCFLCTSRWNNFKIFYKCIAKKIGHSAKILVHWFLENISIASSKRGSCFLMDVVNQITREKSCSQSTPNSTHIHAHTHTHTQPESLHVWTRKSPMLTNRKSRDASLFWPCFQKESREKKKEVSQRFPIRCLLLIYVWS